MSQVAAAMPASREFMSTLTGGWRFTLPARLRESTGWVEGTRLLATVAGQILVLTGPPAESSGSEEATHASDARPDPSGSDAPRDPSAECYLGAGGKIIVPATLRKALGWEPGKRLVVAEDNGGLLVSPCCSLKRCRSCGSTANVREIIPNVYLCADCWGKYAVGVRQTTTWGRIATRI